MIKTLDFLVDLCEVKIGDAIAHNQVYIGKRITSIDKLLETAEDIINKKECYSLKDLKINGSDLKKLGYKGEKIGEKLNRILNEVIENKLENDREILLNKVK